MEKLLKDEFGLDKKLRLRLGVGLAVFLGATVLACFGLYFSTRSVIVKQVTSNVANVSQLNEDSISRAIVNRKVLMRAIADRVVERNIEDVDAILRELVAYAGSYGFSNMGILDEKDRLYTTDSKVLDASDLTFIDEVRSDDFYISESYQPLDGGKYMVNIFSYPLYLKSGKRYHILATYYSRNLTERMNTTSLRGTGYTFIMNSQGKVVIFPQDYEDETYNDLMNFLDDGPEIIPQESGDGYFQYKGERYYAHFEKLEVNDWYLMTCARRADAFAGLHVIIRNGTVAIVLMWFFILLGIIIMFGTIFRTNRERRNFAFYDGLLGIGNGNALAVTFKKLSPKIRKDMYLVIFDIDRFKEFNYIYGEEAGDRLLQYIVQVFREDFPEIYLFRYFSDYFITLDRCQDQKVFEGKIERLMERFKGDIDRGEVQPFDVSMGIRKIQEGEPLQRILSDALIARGVVKGNHIRHYAFYDDEIRHKRVRYMEMETSFPTALQNNEFRVYYQPKYNMITGEIIGAEALARWVKDDGTVISPGEFIPCFEQSRQVILLDETILRGVCRQMREMQSEGIHVKPVSVNLSRVHLRHPDILSKIESIVKESGIDPTLLSFEITESALYEDSIPLKTIVTYIHSLGCQVDMDDYGVGVSGPNALASNSFDTVKLDKSFVDGLGNARIEDVIRSTAAMAKKWDMKVIAEGVENPVQIRSLVGLGCVLGQGFYYSRPMPEEAYRTLLRTAPRVSGMGLEISGNARYFSRSVCRLLDSNRLPTYIVDPERFIVRYCNEAMCKALGTDPTGGLCYRRMRGLSQPCQECSAMRLYRDGDDSPKEFLSMQGIWVMLYTSFVHWQGRSSIQITCVDISKQKALEEQLRQLPQK
ncbi:MAG: EAL domain-containing protein [Eubacteriales bacterium]|nr:EAL domain-containing protein [Eubacteriales bacterium]